MVFDYSDKYGVAIEEMKGYLASGRMLSKEDVVRGGIEKFPDALNSLFSGNFGKLVLCSRCKFCTEMKASKAALESKCDG